MLNTAVNQGSFELSRLQRETTRLTDEQQSLEQQIDRWAAPDALERRARRMGMVPGGSPAFLQDDGTVRGTPEQVSAAPSAPGSSAAPGALPQPSPQPPAHVPATADGAIQIVPAAPATGGGAR
ncbi:septum formation initiator family protein [Peterkaempfera bronchialis]|uniref:Septum formation initiator family protein n=2 Tax=Peterkaempfera bronchialis TaxID=2126346 RepID=A0A345T5F9_9ACTN|nr:septum formation initiator family protein [Peterkaempfera bronchialis]